MKKMKAISVKQPWASLIAIGLKSIETRTWATDYRGEILIVASKQPDNAAMKHFSFLKESLSFGAALCMAELVDCQPMISADEKPARCPLYDGAYAWVLNNIRGVTPFEVKGRLGIYEVELPDTFIIDS